MHRSLENHRDTPRWVSHSYEVLDALSEVNAGMKEIEFGQRSFIITGEELYLSAREREAVRINDALARIKHLTIDNSHQQLRAIELGHLALARLQLLENTVALYRSQGFAAARAHIKFGVSHRSMETLLKQTDTMEKEERAPLVQHSAETERSADRTFSVGGLMVALALAGIVLLWWRIWREVAERHSAGAALHNLKQYGDLKLLAEQLRGRNEEIAS